MALDAARSLSIEVRLSGAWRHAVVRKIITLCLCLLICALGFAPAKAQTNDLSVHFSGSYMAGPPGTTVTVPVTVVGTTGVVPVIGVEIAVPDALQVLGSSTCKAETAFATANAEIQVRPCEILEWKGVDNSRTISVDVKGLTSTSSFRISLLLQIKIPADVPVGSTFELSAPNKYFCRLPTGLGIRH